MLINLRNALMTGKRLPYDAEVEYLESTGTQYIDTGIIGGSSSKVEILASSPNTAQNMGLFGSRNASLVKAFTIWQSVTNISVRFDFAGDTTNRVIANAAWDTSGVNTVIKDGPNNTLNGVAGANNATATFTCEYPFYLFSINSAGAATSNASARVYSCKIWQNGVLVRDFIPVRKGTVGYLYDRVTGKLFGNAGTGDFQYGQDVVPVEWLEGGQLDSGIAFIDTGYAPNSSTKVESTSAILSAAGYSGRFGNQSRFTFGAANGSLYLAQGGHYFLGGYTAGTFYSFVNDIVNRTVSVEGVGSTSTAAVSNWYPQLYPIYLFASNVAPTAGKNVNGKQLDTNSLGQIRMKSCNIWENDIPVRKFLPVRVGTDATSWEGAMMDVLTRRIYRNAGTGAFTYGNDLKYPIPAS